MSSFDLTRFIPVSALIEAAEARKESYNAAAPFAHAVFDGMFDEEILDRVIDEFHGVDEGWKEFQSKYEKKLQMNRYANLPTVTRHLVDALNSEPFLQFLTTLTGIEGLIPDPYLQGGGIHKIEPGGKLGIHVDFNQHSIMKVYRRINVIVYLNRNWREEYGGHFELWDENRNGCEKKISPAFNRMAIFNTTSTSFHGHPEPLNCPSDRCRLSLALYYYTAHDCGDQSSDLHSTIFLTEEGGREELSQKRSFISRVKKKLRVHL